LAALFALAVQIALGTAAPGAGIRPTAEQQLAALLADPGAICHGSAGGDRQAPHHHATGCLLCPYCGAIGAVAVLHGGNPTLPIPRAGPIAVRDAAAPPPVHSTSPFLAAQPRGPPILV
jgi:hypothetical protein